MSEADVERLRAVAGEVFLFHSSPWRIEPGPAGWSVIRSAGVVDGDEFHDGGTVEHDTFVVQCDTTSTSEHIATFDPPTVLALLDRLAAAEERANNAEQIARLAEESEAGWRREAEGLAEVVGRVASTVDQWPIGDNGQDYRRAVIQCHAAIRAALGGDGGGMGPEADSLAPQGDERGQGRVVGHLGERQDGSGR